MTAYDCIASSHFLSVQIADWPTGLKTYQPGRKGGEGVREREKSTTWLPTWAVGTSTS